MDFRGTLVFSCVLSHPVWLFAAPVMGLIIWFCFFPVKDYSISLPALFCVVPFLPLLSVLLSSNPHSGILLLLFSPHLQHSCSASFSLSFYLLINPVLFFTALDALSGL